MVSFSYNCMKIELVQFCFAVTEIDNNSMKKVNQKCMQVLELENIYLR